MSAEQSRLRTTLLGSLLDVARRNRARGAGAVRAVRGRLGVSAPRPARGARRALPRRRAAARARCARPAGASPSRGAADFFAAKGVLAGVLDALRVDWTVQAGAEPFLHPGPRGAASWSAGEPAGWLGELHPALAAEWDLEGTVAGFELDLDAVPEPADPAVRRCHELPRDPRGPRRRRAPTRSAPPRCSRVVRRAGAPLLAGAEVFDVYRNPERLGEGNVSLALRLSFRARGPHAHRQRGGGPARADHRRARRRAGRADPFLASRSSGPPGSPARWPRGCCTRHPAFELRGGDRAQRRRRAPGRPLPPPPRADGARGARSRPPRRRRGRDRRLPARRRGRARRRPARARRAGGRPQRRLPPARRHRLRRTGTASTRCPS